MAMLVFLRCLFRVSRRSMMRRMSLCVHRPAHHAMGIFDVGYHVFRTFLYALILVLADCP